MPITILSINKDRIPANTPSVFYVAGVTFQSKISNRLNNNNTNLKHVLPLTILCVLFFVIDSVSFPKLVASLRRDKLREFSCFRTLRVDGPGFHEVRQGVRESVDFGAPAGAWRARVLNGTVADLNLVTVGWF